MDNSLYYKHVKENSNNISILKELELYVENNKKQQVYAINAPLGEKYTYPYQENVLVILSPKHKLMFIDLKGDDDDFDEYYDDFIEDLNSISDKFKYKDHIGRPRDWKKNNTIKIYHGQFYNFANLFGSTYLTEKISELANY